jgi:hypothetical protein
MTVTDRHTEQRRGRQRLGVVVVVTAFLIVLGTMLTAKTTDTRFGIAASVLGALIASVLGIWLTLYVRDESPGDISRAVGRLDAGLNVLQGLARVSEHAVKFEIDAIKPKSLYTSDEWMEVLTGAQKELVLVGHALDTWCDPDFRFAFSEALSRLARTGGSVRLLTLPRLGANTKTLEQQRGQKYGQRVQTTQEHVAAVYAGLSLTERKNLNVSVLASAIPMPYMVVANEDVLITCAYPTTGESGGMLAIRMSSTSDAGRVIRKDIECLCRDHATPVDLGAIDP